MVRERKAARWMEKREVSMQKQEEIPGSHREVRNVQHNPDPVEHAIEGKNKFLVDGIVRRRPSIPNVIMALLKTPSRSCWLFLVDELVRWTSLTPNIILAQLKASSRRQR